MDELIDIYDSTGSHIGTELRSIAHARGIWHRTAQVWLLNDHDELLLQLRSGAKSSFPGLWDISSAGHIPAGCQPRTSAVRELHEELGLEAREDQLIFLFEHADPYQDKHTGYTDREFADVFLLRVHHNTTFKLQKEEVDEVRWIHYRQLIADYKANENSYVPHHKHFIKLVKAIDKLRADEPTQTLDS